MSATVISGQTIPGPKPPLSAVTPKADKRGRGWNVRYVPKQTFEVRFTPDRPLFGGLRGASAFRGPLLAGCTRGEERNHGAGERTGGEEIQTCLETAGRILDPADDEGADITAKVTDGIDQRDRAGRSRAGEEDRRHRPERCTRTINTDRRRRHPEQGPIGRASPAGKDQADGGKGRGDDEM